MVLVFVLEESGIGQEVLVVLTSPFSHKGEKEAHHQKEPHRGRDAHPHGNSP
jgi:hypothetical protein